MHNNHRLIRTICQAHAKTPIEFYTWKHQPVHYKTLYQVLVKADLEMIGETLNEEEIQRQNVFKSHIKYKIQNASLQYLKSLQMNHKKIKHNEYDKLKIQGSQTQWSPCCSA